MNTPNSHITQEQAGRWTSGLLEAGEAEALEAHVSRCEACSRLLEAEARVEMVLLQATQQPRTTSRPRPRWRRAVVPLAAAAAAFGLAVLVGLPERRAAASDGGIAESLPPQAFEVPRYEDLSPHTVLTTPAAL